MFDENQIGQIRVGDFTRLVVSFLCVKPHIFQPRKTTEQPLLLYSSLFTFSDKMEKQSLMCAPAFQHIKQGEEQNIV